MKIRYLKKFFSLNALFSGQSQGPVTVKSAVNNNYRGKALVSYIKKAAIGNDFSCHSNKWECHSIISILSHMGFDVDVIDYFEGISNGLSDYDLVFDIHENLQRTAPFLNKKCKKILHITGSYPLYSIDRELQRVKNLELRRGQYYSPKRIVDYGFFRKSLDIADACSLLGNSHTLSTFPDEYRHKIRLIPPTASFIGSEHAEFEKNKKQKNNFIWFYKYGAVHKGLDILLEVFSKRNDVSLNIFGNIDIEKDFLKIYEHELNSCNNIIRHGYVDPSADIFKNVARITTAFIAPSCSEGTSVAVATCLQEGLYPIISMDNGVDLPDGCGIVLDQCSHEEINHAIDKLLELPLDIIEKQVGICQNYALEKFSRHSFESSMRLFLNSVVQ